MLARAIRTSKLRLVFVAACFLGALAAGTFQAGSVSQASAQEKKADDARGFQPYLKIMSSEYIPSSRGGGKQLIRLKFRVAKYLPVGSKIQMKLQYAGGLTMDETEFVLKNNRREGVVFDWRPKKRLGPDLYTLFTFLRPGEQTAAVRKAITSNKKDFPPALTPWAYTYLDKKDLIPIGTKKELADLTESICSTYEDFIDELVENLQEYNDTVDKVLEGKKYVGGTSLDSAAFLKFLKKWKLKQAATQKKIGDLPVDKPTVHQKSLTAHYNLMNLGRMVSKSAYKKQLEIEKKYGVNRLQPKYDGTKKSDRVITYYDKNWRYTTTRDALTEQVDKIYRQTCPEEEEEEVEAEPASKSTDGAKDGGKKPAGKKASGKKASGKKASGKKASGKKASGKKASGKKSPDK